MSEPKPIRLYNTASRATQVFEPIDPPQVRLYTCGMTVYYYAHIGHVRTYVNSDVLRRFLASCGYRVEHVMNVTDVGHMTSDADEGEDKLEVRARTEGKSPWEIARYYENHFWDTIERVNILPPTVSCRATEHIDEMIGLAKRLEERGYTYRTSVGLIYDTSKFPEYPDFARLNLDGQIAGARTEVDEERKNPSDFALWISNQPNHIMQWDSPWGRGFPGWHIECSAMSMAYLGEELDIHTGGIDHIPVHHTNEIAQSEGATGKRFARVWMHSAFLMVDKTKMSKSLDNLYTLDDLEERGFTPLALRYLYMQSSYRKTMNFSWEGLGAAQTALARLWERCAALPDASGEPDAIALAAFRDAMADDLNTSKAQSVVWEVANRQPSAEVAATLNAMDQVVAYDMDRDQAAQRLAQLDRLRAGDEATQQKAQALAEQRQQMRQERNFAEADALRDQILELGFSVEDTPDGPRLRPRGPEV